MTYKNEDLNRTDLNEPVLNKPDLNQPVLNKPDLNQPVLNKPDLNQPDLNQPDLINRKSSKEYNQQILSISEVNRHLRKHDPICKPNQVRCPYCGGCFSKIDFHLKYCKKVT